MKTQADETRETRQLRLRFCHVLFRQSTANKLSMLTMLERRPHQATGVTRVPQCQSIAHCTVAEARGINSHRMSSIRPLGIKQAVGCHGWKCAHVDLLQLILKMCPSTHRFGSMTSFVIRRALRRFAHLLCTKITLKQHIVISRCQKMYSSNLDLHGKSHLLSPVRRSPCKTLSSYV